MRLNLETLMVGQTQLLTKDVVLPVVPVSLRAVQGVRVGKRESGGWRQPPKRRRSRERHLAAVAPQQQPQVPALLRWGVEGGRGKGAGEGESEEEVGTTQQRLGEKAQSRNSRPSQDAAFSISFFGSGTRS